MKSKMGKSISVLTRFASPKSYKIKIFNDVYEILEKLEGFTFGTTQIENMLFESNRFLSFSWNFASFPMLCSV